MNIKINIPDLQYPSRCLATWWWHICPCHSGTARAQSPARAWIHGWSLPAGGIQGSGGTPSAFHRGHQGRTNTCTVVHWTFILLNKNLQTKVTSYLTISERKHPPRLWFYVDEVLLVSPRNKPHTGASLHGFHSSLYHSRLQFSCLFKYLERKIQYVHVMEGPGVQVILPRDVKLHTVVRGETIRNIDETIHWFGPQADSSKAGFGTSSSRNRNVSVSETGRAVYELGGLQKCQQVKSFIWECRFVTAKICFAPLQNRNQLKKLEHNIPCLSLALMISSIAVRSPRTSRS